MDIEDLPAHVNLRDIEDQITETTSTTPLYGEARDGYTDKFRRSGSFLDPTLFEMYTEALLAESQRLMGQGKPDNILQTFYTRLDRNGNIIVPLPSLNHGYTFITRPRLNLTEPNLKQTPFLTTLDSFDPLSVPFMVRALLDTRLCRGMGMDSYYGVNPTPEEVEFGILASQSPLLDTQNPFLTPVCNALKGISGYPDFTVETETTDGDFHGGDFTYAKGSDMNKRTQELSLEFRDVRGSTILTLFYYWVMYIALQSKGVVVAYPDDIYEQRLNYTVSIYRFVTDTTRKNILWWSKATGCYPISVPVGSIFNMSQDEVTLSAATNFSIPFKANIIEYNDPGILLDFRLLMKRYCPNIENYVDLDYYHTEYGPMPKENFAAQDLNYIGLPYIESDKGLGLRLSWKAPPHIVAMQEQAAHSTNLDAIRDALKRGQEEAYRAMTMSMGDRK